MRRRAARPVWPGPRKARGRPGPRHRHGGEANRTTAEKIWVSAQQRAEAAILRAATAVAAAAKWAALIDVGEMELLLDDQAVEVARVAKAAMEAVAPKAVEKLKSYTKALEATTAQLEARISAALREFSGKVEAEEGLLAEDVLQAAPTCASDGSR